MAKRVYVIHPGVKGVSKPHDATLASHAQDEMARLLEKDERFTPVKISKKQANEKKRGMKGLSLGGFFDVGFGDRVTVKMALQGGQDGKMFMFLEGDGHTGGGRNDKQNVNGAKQVIDALLASKMKAMMAALASR